MTNRFSHIEIGKIPNNWHFGKLGDYVTIETGKRAKGGGLSNGIIPSIGGEHIDKSGNILWENLKFIPEHFYNDLKQGKIIQNDILVVKDGATTGKVAFIKNLPYERIAVNEHVFIIRTKTTDVFNCFLYYVMASSIVQKQIKSIFHGMIGGITREEVSSFVIPMPPFEEQQKIAEILSTVDEVIEKVDKAIEKTERLKKGLMQGLLSGRLKVVESNGQLRLKIRDAKDFGISPIGEIPKEWKVVKLGEVVNLKNGINFDREQKSNKGILTVDVLNMYGAGIEIDFSNLYRIEVPLENYSDFLLKKGDILIVRSSLKREGAGWVSLFNGLKEPITFCGFIIRARLTQSSILPEFLTYYLRCDIARNRLIASAGQVAITNISQEMIKILQVPVPSLSEQQKIITILIEIDKRLHLLKNKRQHFEKIKQQLMNDLLTGKRRVELEVSDGTPSPLPSPFEGGGNRRE